MLHSFEGTLYLELADTSWEDNELSLERLQSLDIGLESLQRTISTSVIDRDANSWGEFLGDTSSLVDTR